MESGQAAPNTVGIRRLKPLSGEGRLRFCRATPVRGGAWGDAYHTLPVHTQAYPFLF
jgi:hypothetical protein